MQNIGQDTIKDLLIPVPPVKEQELINAYIREKAKSIDDMRKEIHEAIARLKEYRTALITAAVTGKIDVRNIKLKDIA